MRDLLDQTYKKPGNTHSNDPCHKCGNEVPSGSKFCNMCGASLARAPGKNTGKTYSADSKTVSHHARIDGPGTTSGTSLEKPNERQPAQEEPAEQCLTMILAQEDVPAFSYHISEVILLMGNDDASLHKLTNTILRDYSLTLAVLRRANSAYYNRSGNPIVSVARAVTLLGVDTVRSLAVSLILFEHYQKGSPWLKELVLLSMLTANHSRQAATRFALPLAEEAYLCGMFRNLGEVLVACHLRDKYSEIQHQAKQGRLSVREACLEVLKFTYEDLGRAMARHWNLPENVSRAMAHFDLDPTRKLNRDQMLEAVVAFSHELTDSMYRRHPTDKDELVGKLLNKYGTALDLNRSQVQELLAKAVTDTKATFAAIGISLGDLELQSQTWTAFADQKIQDPAQPGCTPDPSREEEHRTNLELASAATARHEDLLDHQLAEVQAAVSSGAELDVNSIIMMILEAFHRGAGFDRVILCLTARDRSHIHGRFGLGSSIDEVVARLHIPLQDRNEPLAVALLTKVDLFCDNQRDNPYRDSPLIRSLEPACFGLYPLSVDSLVVGCLYFDRLTPGVVPSPQVLATLVRLRNILAGVIRTKRPAL